MIDRPVTKKTPDPLSFTTRRISTGESAMRRFAGSESEKERRAFVRLRIRPNAPAMTMNDPLYDCKADAGALVFLGPVQPLENAEQLVSVPHVEADAVVLDEIRGLAISRPVKTANFDRRGWPSAGVFQGVGKQVRPDLFDQGRIAGATRQLADAQLGLPGRQFAAELIDGLLDDVGHLDRLPFERLPTEA